MIPLTSPTFNREMENAAINALNNEKMVGGESVHQFEEDFAKYIGTDYAATVNSGSSAILLAFYSLGIKAKDRVMAPSATFIATLNGPCSMGAIPVFCEIGSDYVISTGAMKKIFKNEPSEYVIPVHLYGHPCDMSEIIDIAQKKNIVVIEDAAQAHGAKYNGKRIGSFGDAAIFSFYPTKNMTVGGDGGMVTTDNKKIYDSVLKMRDVGRRTKYTHDKIGYTLRLNSVNAAIGKVQLRHLDEWNKRRNYLANIYYQELNGVGDLVLPPRGDAGKEPVYHLFVLKTDKRNELGAWLTMNRIGTSIHYPIPVHKQPAYSMYQNEFDLHFTDNWSNTVLSIPMYPDLGLKDQKYITYVIQRFYEEKLYQSEKVKKETAKWSTQ